MAVAIGVNVEAMLGFVRRLEKQSRVYYRLAGGPHWVLMVLSQDDTPGYDSAEETMFLLKEWAVLRDPDVKVETEQEFLPDEDGKINLNTAPEDVLKRLFHRAGVEDPAMITDSIIDWRDEDDDARPYGAEDFYYQTLPEPYECKDEAFESVEELLLVRGMSFDLWERVKSSITVYGSGSVNMNTASEETLAVMGLSEPAVSAIVVYKAGEDDRLGTPDDRVFTSTQQILMEMDQKVPIEDQNRLAQFVQDGFLGVTSQAYIFSARGELTSEKDRRSLWAVVDRAGRIAAWREG
ncbi:MAG: general secretion pathway protein GspK [Candidatus Omnitrophica bacterium]|nr:general secretion pathway protein GspK [Candidatus Omnitrophota bacterium]